MALWLPPEQSGCLLGEAGLREGRGKADQFPAQPQLLLRFELIRMKPLEGWEQQGPTRSQDTSRDVAAGVWLLLSQLLQVTGTVLGPKSSFGPSRATPALGCAAGRGAVWGCGVHRGRTRTPLQSQAGPWAEYGSRFPNGTGGSGLPAAVCPTWPRHWETEEQRGGRRSPGSPLRYPLPGRPLRPRGCERGTRQGRDPPGAAGGVCPVLPGHRPSSLPRLRAPPQPRSSRAPRPGEGRWQ